MAAGMAVNCTMRTWAGVAVETVVLAELCKLSVFFTVKRKLYVCPAAAVNVATGVLALASATVGPVICTQLYVNGRPSGSYEPEPFSVMVPAGTPNWLGPASATGGLEPTRRVPNS